MNRNEELHALADLAMDETVPRFYDMTISCKCLDAISGISDIDLNMAKLCAASNALDAGWRFDKKAGKALCKKCWDAKEAQDGQKG